MTPSHKYSFHAVGSKVVRRWSHDDIDSWRDNLDSIKEWSILTIVDNDTEGEMMITRRKSGITLQALTKNFDLITSHSATLKKLSKV